MSDKDVQNQEGPNEMEGEIHENEFLTPEEVAELMLLETNADPKECGYLRSRLAFLREKRLGYVAPGLTIEQWRMKKILDGWFDRLY